MQSAYVMPFMPALCNHTHSLLFPLHTITLRSYSTFNFQFTSLFSQIARFFIDLAKK